MHIFASGGVEALKLANGAMWVLSLALFLPLSLSLTLYLCTHTHTYIHTSGGVEALKLEAANGAVLKTLQGRKADQTSVDESLTGLQVLVDEALHICMYACVYVG